MGYGPQDHKRIRQDLASKQQQQQKHLLLSWFSVLAALKKKKIQTLGPHPRPTTSKSLGVRPSISIF